MSIFSKDYYQGKFIPKHIEKCMNYNHKVFTKDQPITFRSSWELIICRFCDEEDAVIAWGSEILKVSYIFEGKEHQYIVDFIIIVKNKHGDVVKWIVEVKPDNQSEHFDENGNVIYPPAPKKKTQKAIMRWQEKCAVITKNSKKWEAARNWTYKMGWIHEEHGCKVPNFKVLTENEIFSIFKCKTT